MTESQLTEYEQSWRDEYLKWICGFANAGGGVLVIGRNDKGQVTGIPNVHRQLVELSNKVGNVLGILVAVNLQAEDEKEYPEIGKTTRTIELQLAKLRKARMVIRVGPAKGGHWEIIGGGDE